jgi:hypothetical protein
MENIKIINALSTEDKKTLNILRDNLEKITIECFSDEEWWKMRNAQNALVKFMKAHNLTAA